MSDMAQERLASTRECTCHPDDRPAPCEHKYAVSECWASAVLKETQTMIIGLKNKDRSIVEQVMLNYLMRVRRALDG